MKAVYMTAWVGIVALGMAVFGAFAGAAPDAASPAPPEAKAGAAPVKAEKPACSMCPMMAGAGKGMDSKMEMPPAMKQHCRMMMNAEMCKNDPACLLASKQELKLTPEQVQKLEQILKESRQAAAAIITPEQQKTLAEVAGPPESMIAMHAKMHEAIRKSEAKEKKTPVAAAPKPEAKEKKAPVAAAPKPEENAKKAPEAAASKK